MYDEWQDAHGAPDVVFLSLCVVAALLLVTTFIFLLAQFLFFASRAPSEWQIIVGKRI